MSGGPLGAKDFLGGFCEAWLLCPGFTAAQEEKMGQSRARRSSVSLGVTREDFLAEKAPPLAFRGKQSALSEIRESAGSGMSKRDCPSLQREEAHLAVWRPS